MSFDIYEEGYIQAFKDLEQKLDNAIANDGGINIGNGQFVKRAHWDSEIRNQIIELKKTFYQ